MPLEEAAKELMKPPGDTPRRATPRAKSEGDAEIRPADPTPKAAGNGAQAASEYNRRHPFGQAESGEITSQVEPAAPVEDAADPQAEAAVRARARRAARDRAVWDVEHAAQERLKRNPFNSMSCAELRAVAASRVRRRAAVARSIAATTPMLPAAKARLYGVVWSASSYVRRTAGALSTTQRRQQAEEAAALRIQTRVRGILARRAANALRARSKLEHALEVMPVVPSALTARSMESCLDELQAALVATSSRTAAAAAPPPGQAPGAGARVHSGGATAEELLRIYEEEGEAAALAFAARETLRWTQLLLEPPPPAEEAPAVPGATTPEAGNSDSDDAGAEAKADAFFAARKGGGRKAASGGAPAVSVVAPNSAISAEVNGFFKPSARAVATAVTSPTKGGKGARKTVVVLSPRAKRLAGGAASGSDDDDASDDEVVLAARAKLAAKQQAAAAQKKEKYTGPLMTRDRATVVIQAHMRGLVARRWAEVQRCRLDLRGAVAEAKERPEEAHPEVIQCMLDLGEAYLRAWDPHNAEQAYSVALESIEREYGAGDPRCRKPAEILARIFADRGDVAMAQEVLHRALGDTSAPVPASAEEAAEYEEYNNSGPLKMVFQLGAWMNTAAVDGDEIA